MTGGSSMRTSRGFTLLELLVAMSLLAGLGALLVGLVDNSFDLYADGDRRADLYQAGIHVLDRLEDDLAAVHGGPEGRFLLFDADRKEARPGGGFLLRLVRSIPGGEQEHPELRAAGSTAGAERVWEGTDPGREERREVAPPSGLMEVAWALIQEPGDPEGLLTLYRGTRAPPFAKGGFFDEDAQHGYSEKWVRKHLKPVATDVLGVWVLCYAQSSVDWFEDDVLDGRAPGDGALQVWDSTRGILEGDRFPLARGPGSKDDTRDDILPRKVRVIVQVARGWSPDARLRRRLEPGDKQILVNSTRRFPPADSEVSRYVKIGPEWLLLGATDASGAAVTRRRRRSVVSRKAPGVGTPVYSGLVFKKTMDIAAHRSHWSGGQR